jgi:predicted nucleic acid-binding protein
MDSWVVDAGPFIHLDQIGSLELLKRLPSLIIPPSVVGELTTAKSRPTLETVTRWPNVTIVPPPREPLQVLERVGRHTPLHRGEWDCLRLALERSPCVFLTDDLAARTAAEQLHLEVHGTVGLIAYAVRRQWFSISNAEEALKALYHRSSLFITYAIIERAIRRLKEDRPHSRR